MSEPSDVDLRYANSPSDAELSAHLKSHLPESSRVTVERVTKLLENKSGDRSAIVYATDYPCWIKLTQRQTTPPRSILSLYGLSDDGEELAQAHFDFEEHGVQAEVCEILTGLPWILDGTTEAASLEALISAIETCQGKVAVRILQELAKPPAEEVLSQFEQALLKFEAQSLPPPPPPSEGLSRCGGAGRPAVGAGRSDSLSSENGSDTTVRSATL